MIVEAALAVAGSSSSDRNIAIMAEDGAGIYHFGVVVEDMGQATEMWKARGADVREITLSSGTKAILSNIYDPNGVRMELLQLPPDSLHAQATNRWK